MRASSNPDRAAADEAFFRRALASAIGVTAFLEFYGNLVVLPLPLELVLQPTLILVVLLRTVAGLRSEFTNMKTLLDPSGAGLEPARQGGGRALACSSSVAYGRVPPEPPRGYPGKNSAWLDGPAARDANWAGSGSG